MKNVYPALKVNNVLLDNTAKTVPVRKMSQSALNHQIVQHEFSYEKSNELSVKMMTRTLHKCGPLFLSGHFSCALVDYFCVSLQSRKTRIHSSLTSDEPFSHVVSNWIY